MSDCHRAELRIAFEPIFQFESVGLATFKFDLGLEFFAQVTIVCVVNDEFAIKIELLQPMPLSEILCLPDSSA